MIFAADPRRRTRTTSRSTDRLVTVTPCGWRRGCCLGPAHVDETLASGPGFSIAEDTDLFVPFWARPGIVGHVGRLSGPEVFVCVSLRVSAAKSSSIDLSAESYYNGDNSLVKGETP